MDKCDELKPDWLDMVKGAADSEDLLLNISGKVLQQNRISRVIEKEPCEEVF